MAYQPYGYELMNLLERYGVNSPVSPRRQEGQSDADYGAILKHYTDSVSSTPMYNIPEGSVTYRELLKNTLYGDPKTYYETRGITDPAQMYQKADEFGWTPQQWDYSMGAPPGTAQNWIDNNNPISSRVPYTYPYGTTPPTTPATPSAPTAPTTPATPSAPTAPSAPATAPWAPISHDYDDTQWRAAIDSWAAANPNASKADIDAAILQHGVPSYLYGYAYSKTNAINDPTVSQSYEPATQETGFLTPNVITGPGGADLYGMLNKTIYHAARNNAPGETQISTQEADEIFDMAKTLGLSVSQLTENLNNLTGRSSGGNPYSEQEVADYIRAHFPDEADAYFSTTRSGYAEGGRVEEDPLDAILRRYQTQPEPNLDAQIAALREIGAQRKAAIEAANVPQEGPSDSEKWLRLAAAFANPGQTGNFMEGVGHAADVLADHNASSREFAAADQDRRNQAALAALGVDQDVAETELRLGLEDRDRYDRRLDQLLARKPDYSNLDMIAEGYRRMNEAREGGDPMLASVYESALMPKRDTSFSERDQAQARFLQTQYEGYMRLARDAAEMGDTAAVALYEGLADDVAAKIEGLLGGGQPVSRGPGVGDVVDGYEFLGGNPNDQGSWRPVATPEAPVATAAPEPAAAPIEPPAQPAGALEGFNLESPQTPFERTSEAIGSVFDRAGEAIGSRIHDRVTEREARVAEKSVPMVKSIIESRDLYKLGLLSDVQLDAAVKSGELTPEEVEIVNAYRAK